MEAVRLRKENQVIDADQRRSLAIKHHEERAKRENTIMSDFRELLSKKQREADMRVDYDA
jgi:hypothetical protein